MAYRNNQVKREDQIIDRIYRLHCSGMQISIMRIPRLFEMARLMLREGATHDAVGRAMVKFVNTEE